MTGTTQARAPYPSTVVIPGIVSPAASVGTWTVALAATDLFNGRITGTAQSNSISWDVALAAGPVTFDLYHYRDIDGGIYTVSIDGVSVGTIDGYCATGVAGPRKSSIVGAVVTYSGIHRVTLTMSTKNASSTGYVARVNGIGFIRQDVPAVTMTNPLTAITWDAAYWSEDPLWTPPANGAQIDSWRDGSGNSRDAVNTGTNRPRYVVHDPLLNNRAAVFFNAAGVQSLASPSFTRAQTFSVTMILSGANAVLNGRVFGAQNASVIQIFQSSGSQWTFFAGASDTVDICPSGGTIITAVFAGSSSKVLAGPTLYTAQVCGSNSLSGGLRIGGTSDGSSSTATCNVAFVGVYAGDITANASWADFKAWARANYGVTSG
jgi:hypothetical protein